ncbi:MAG: ATP-binding protein [Microthrixaceae bacterium]
MNSVRVRITLVATVLNAVVLVAASVLILTLVERSLIDSTKETIDRAAGMAAEELGFDLEEGVYVEVRTVAGLDLEGVFATDGEFVSGVLFGPDLEEVVVEVVLDADTGEVVEVYDPLAGTLEPALAPADPLRLIEEVSFVEEDLGEGVLDGLGEDAVANAEASVRTVRNALILIVPIVVVLLGAATWFLVGRTLRPVHAISEKVRRIGSESLDERVPVPESADEVSELAGTMNEMLDRLETGANRQRRFVADASHELRTPLSTIRAAAEIATVEDPDGAWGRSADDVVAEADRMERLISDLLELARLDEQRREKLEVRDLGALLSSAVAQLAPTDPDGPEVRLECNAVELRCVPGLIEELIVNLLQNAVHYANALVAVSAGPTSGQLAVLVVEDDGPGIPADVRDEVFERFVRVGSSRQRSSGGSGLGLSIARAVVERHGGSISLDSSPGLGGARFTVSLPLD